MLLTTCLALFPLVQDADTDWFLLRGPRDLPAQTSYEAIAKLYLQGESCTVVSDQDAEIPASKSRFIFGSITDHPIAAEVFRELGGRVEAGKLNFASMTLVPEAGLVIVAPDVDGEGDLILMTGGNAEGAFACLTASVDVGKHGWTAIYEGKVRGRGALPESAASSAIKLKIDSETIRIVRLDRDAEHLLALLEGSTDDEAALRVARSLRGYQDVIRALGFESVLAYGRWLLEEGPTILKERKEAAEKAPALLSWIRNAVNKELGKGFGTAEATEPVYFFVWGRPDGTNARMFGKDPETGRLRVLLNIAALDSSGKFLPAAVHETVHTRQTRLERDLKGRAAMEGVACFLSAEIWKSFSEAEALMWSEEELAAARKHEDAILSAFERAANTGNPRALNAFLVLGAKPFDVPEAPSRTAYWIGYEAAKRWRAANPDAPLEAMLHLGANDLFPTD